MDTNKMIADFVAELDNDSRDINKMQTIVNELSDTDLHLLCDRIIKQTNSNNVDN